MPLNEYNPEHINLNELLSIMERMLIAVTQILELLRSIDSMLSRGLINQTPVSAEQDIMRALGV